VSAYPSSIPSTYLEDRESLKSTADHLETLISEKRFLQAAVLLVQSLKLANKPDMQDIGAVSELRGYLQTQEAVRRRWLLLSLCVF
jgi:exocyst complex component 4